MLQHVKVYCRESSIHGLSYVVNDDIHWAEKTFWLLALFTSGLCCGAMIAEIAMKFDEDAIITYTADTAIPVTQIAFVAVTFCPDLLTYNDFFDYNQTTGALIRNEISIENVTQDELKYLQAVGLVLNDNFLVRFNLSIDTEDVLTFIRNLTYDWSKVNKDSNFDDRFGVEFAEIVGPLGFCYSFNIIEPHKLFNLEILPEVFNFTRPIEIHKLILKYQRRSMLFKNYGLQFPAKVTNYRFGFMLINNMIDHSRTTNLDENHHRSQVEYGSHFIFHSPYDFPSKSSAHFRSKISYAQQYFVEPQQKIIDKSLLSAKPSKLGCYRDGQKDLKFFKVSSKANCQSECLANKTLSVCHCVQFFMVRERGTRICGIADFLCFNKIEKLEKERDSCECLADCDEVTYAIEQRQMEFVKYKAFDSFVYHQPTLASKIQVYFKSPEFYPFVSQLKFSWIDFVASVGGTFGLFLGFSLISFVEIFYFFSARILFEYLRRKKVNDRVIFLTENHSTKPLHFLSEFFKESSIHGLNQIVHHRRNFLERFFWIIVVSVALIYSEISARDIYAKYTSAPILFSLDDNPELQEKIPFPAITFTNEVIFNSSYVFRYKLFGIFGRPSNSMFSSLKKAGIYDDFLIKGLLADIDFLKTLNYSNATDFDNFIGKIKNLSQDAWFKRQTATWNSLYQPEFIKVPTKRGFGFAFNMISPLKLFKTRISKDFVDNTLIKLNSSKAVGEESKQYPLTASNKGGNGLKLILSRNSEIASRDIKRYLTFAIHSPYDLASSYDEIETCEFYFGYDLDILITPEVIYTDPALRRYTPKERNCFFSDEKQLKFFKVYSRKNCEFECLSKFLSSMPFVNCTPFYFVREETDKLCDIRIDLNVTFYKFRFDKNVNNILTNCECLDECDSLKYKFEISTMIRSDYNESDNWYSKDIDAVLSFRMTDDSIFPLRRHQPFTFNEFLAQSGGLMGLFASISVMSIIEIFYFSTLRMLANLWRMKRSRS